jgi:hypothetical protein
MNVEIGAEAALFPEKEDISGIFVAVRASLLQAQQREKKRQKSQWKYFNLRRKNIDFKKFKFSHN